MRLSIYVFLILASLSLNLAAYAGPTDCLPATSRAATWVGTYEFSDDGGETAAGVRAIVDRKIVVKEKGEDVEITFSSMGYQADEKILCDNAVDIDKLLLLFRSYSNGKVKNEYGVQVYKKGAHLLTLERKNMNGKTKILTYWKEFTPNDPKAKSGQVLFKLKKK